MSSSTAPPSPRRRSARADSHFRELLWQTLSRQVLLYFLPLLLLAVFFHIQYRQIFFESERAHLQIIAEHQAATLDLFLRERLVNLANVLDDPAFPSTDDAGGYLESVLGKLRKTSEAFVDVGLVDAHGDLRHYHGPVKYGAAVNYAGEAWFDDLVTSDRRAVITDIYLGFRNAPHFTIAVKRAWGERLVMLRSALSPERIAEYLSNLEGAREVNACVLNRDGVFQVVTPRVGEPLQSSGFDTPTSPRRGHVDASQSRGSAGFAYAWLEEVPWALVVEHAGTVGSRGTLAWMPSNVYPFTVAFFLVMGVVIVVRARQLVNKQLATEEHEAQLSGQLVQAAKLASVGELAAGIAHEINNPLAIIAEEVGLLRDMMDPTLAEEGEDLDLQVHLGIIHDAVFRCRDITRKLLTFVRHAEVKLAAYDLHGILDEVVDGMLGNELTISNVHVVREYDDQVGRIVTDRNQLVQVILNLVKNAIDAMAEGGTLTVRTVHKGDRVVFTVGDTGCGLTHTQLQKVFMPFFTTKEPGKGTGLGLSVSLSIIRNFGGNMYVDSALGEGSAFTVELPYAADT